MSTVDTFLNTVLPPSSAASPLAPPDGSFGRHLSRASQPARPQDQPRREDASATSESDENLEVCAGNRAGCGIAPESKPVTERPARSDLERAEPPAAEGADDEGAQHEPSAEEQSLAAADAQVVQIKVAVEQPLVGDELALSAEAVTETVAGELSPTDFAKSSKPKESLQQATGEQPPNADASNVVEESEQAMGDLAGAGDASKQAAALRVSQAAADVRAAALRKGANNSKDKAVEATEAKLDETPAAGTEATTAEASTRRTKESKAASKHRAVAAEETNEALAATPTDPTGDAAMPADRRAIESAAAAISASQDSSSASSSNAQGQSTNDAALQPLAGSADGGSRPTSQGVARSNRNGEGPNLSEVERARFVQRVAKAFQAAEEQGSPIRLRLAPPELGALKLEVTVRAGVMTARLETETTAARNVLLDSLPALRERLAQQEIKVERFDVDLMGQSPGDMPHGSPGETPRDQRAAAANRVRAVPRPVGAPIAPAATIARSASTTGLNIII